MTILLAPGTGDRAAATAPADLRRRRRGKLRRASSSFAGAILPERGPDGNTVVFDAPEGLVVVDTGRHAWHSDAILAYAKSRGRPVAAIVNTHWHLDHTSGNGRIKAAFPEAPVYATNAVDRVLAEGGFLARNLESAQAMLDDPKIREVQKEEVRIFIATMDERDVLRPQVVVKEAGEARLAGRSFDFRVTDGAVTDADLWFYDRRERCRGDRRPRDAPRAVLRDSLPRRLATVAGRGLCRCPSGLRSPVMANPWTGGSSTPGAARSTPSWTASKGRPRPASARLPGQTGDAADRRRRSRAP